jgi:hypothetical protein
MSGGMSGASPCCAFSIAAAGHTSFQNVRQKSPRKAAPMRLVEPDTPIANKAFAPGQRRRYLGRHLFRASDGGRGGMDVWETVCPCGSWFKVSAGMSTTDPKPAPTHCRKCQRKAFKALLEAIDFLDAADAAAAAQHKTADRGAQLWLALSRAKDRHRYQCAYAAWLASTGNPRAAGRRRKAEACRLELDAAKRAFDAYRRRETEFAALI